MTSEPGIVLKNQALKIIPLVGRVEPRGMMEDLPRSHGFVAVPLEMHGQGNRIGQLGTPPLTVVVNPRGRGAQAQHHGRPARATDRGCGMGIGEGNAQSAQPFEVRGMDLSRIPTEGTDPIVHVVHRKEKHVGLAGRKDGGREE